MERYLTRNTPEIVATSVKAKIMFRGDISCKSKYVAIVKIPAKNVVVPEIITPKRFERCICLLSKVKSFWTGSKDLSRSFLSGMSLKL